MLIHVPRAGARPSSQRSRTPRAPRGPFWKSCRDGSPPAPARDLRGTDESVLFSCPPPVKIVCRESAGRFKGVKRAEKKGTLSRGREPFHRYVARVVVVVVDNGKSKQREPERYYLA